MINLNTPCKDTGHALRVVVEQYLANRWVVSDKVCIWRQRHRSARAVRLVLERPAISREDTVIMCHAAFGKMPTSASEVCRPSVRITSPEHTTEVSHGMLLHRPVMGPSRD